MCTAPPYGYLPSQSESSSFAGIDIMTTSKLKFGRKLELNDLGFVQTSLLLIYNGPIVFLR